jgi:hypothetical protein
MEEALRLVLPMAKGYAAAHSVGRNALSIEMSEQALTAYNDFMKGVK